MELTSIRNLAARAEPNARLLALFALAVIFSGGERYFANLSKLLHYGFDVALLAALGVLLIARPSRIALRVIPYALWICLYYAWGVAVSTDRSVIRSAAASDVILNLLILSTVALAVTTRSDVGRLAGYVQFAVIANFAFALAQAINFHVLVEMAYILDPRTFSYNIYRPAGLWIDPNVAGIGYLFGFLISLLLSDRRLLAWSGRSAALIGILFTGSREAMYPLLVCCGVVAVVYAYRRGWRLKRLTALKIPAVVPAAAAAILIAAALAVWLSPMREPVMYNLHRFLDASARGPAEPSRFQLATYWINRAVHGPWYGSGVFSFQGNGRTVYGAHNIYLTVWGEVGGPLLAIYMTVLALGVVWLLRAKLPLLDLTTLALMWATYLVLGFTWHNQFSAVESIVVAGLLYVVPQAISDPVAASSLLHDLFLKPARPAIRTGMFTH